MDYSIHALNNILAANKADESRSMYKISCATTKLELHSTLQCCIVFMEADMMSLPNLNGVTHLYAFFGFKPLVLHTARLAAETLSLVLMCVVCVHENDLIEAGLLSKDESKNEDITRMGGMMMSGSFSYPAFLIPVTPRRRQDVKKAAAAIVLADGSSENLVEKAIDLISQGAEAIATYHAEFSTTHNLPSDRTPKYKKVLDKKGAVVKDKKGAEVKKYVGRRGGGENGTDKAASPEKPPATKPISEGDKVRNETSRLNAVCKKNDQMVQRTESMLHKLKKKQKLDENRRKKYFQAHNIASK